MDEQRALLDRLMGFNRDGDRPDDAAIDFAHARVCKPWLCGLCPRELFQNTRLDAGACELLHIPHLRAAYEQSARGLGYERDLANELSRLLTDVEKKIARGQKRLEEDAQDGQDAQDGDRAKRRDVQDVNQKLRVCDVCGAFLSIFDSDRRLADHFGGKLHVGYVQIRQKLQELQETKDKEPPKRRRERSRERIERSVERRKRSVEWRDRDRRSSRQRTRRSPSSSRSRSRDRMLKRRRH